MNKLLTFLLLYRSSSLDCGSHPHRDLTKFLKNIESTFIDKEDLEKIEVLVKIDTDDERAIALIPTLTQYPFSIRHFIYNKWEGRFSFNYHQTYLFTKINPTTKFIQICADDIHFYPQKARNLIKELEQYKDEEYRIFWGVPNELPDNQILTLKLPIYDKELPYNKLTVFSTPIMSRKIIECIGGCGWLQNYDDTFAILIYILSIKYKINIVKLLQSLVTERKNNYREESLEDNEFNRESRIADIEYNPDSYFYRLVEQQALNIYLNIKEDGKLNDY